MNDEATYIFSGSHLLPGWQQKDVIADGALLVSGNTIEVIGRRSELVRKYPGVPHIHEPHGLIMPGLINSCTFSNENRLNTHAWGRFAADHSRDGSGISTVEPEPDLLHSLRLLSIVVMLKSGTTSYCDVSPAGRETLRTIEETGIRAWLPALPQRSNGEQIIGQPGPDEPGSAALQSGSASLVSPIAVIDLNASHPRYYHTHSAANSGIVYILLPQSERAHQDFMEQFGSTPVQHLLKRGLLDSRCRVIPGTVITYKDLTLLHENSVKIIYCQGYRQGRDPQLSQIVLASSPVSIHGLGTGGPSARPADMFRLMNRVAKSAKVSTMDPTVMDAETTLWTATTGGAELLGAADNIATLESGKRADFIVVDLHKPHLTPLYNVVSHLVYAAGGADVKHSIINGRIVMQNRNLPDLDEKLLLRRIQDMCQSPH